VRNRTPASCRGFLIEDVHEALASMRPPGRDEYLNGCRRRAGRQFASNGAEYRLLVRGTAIGAGALQPLTSSAKTCRAPAWCHTGIEIGEANLVQLNQFKPW